MADQPNLPKTDVSSQRKESRVDGFEFEPIKGYPMLNWKGKRPFTSTHYYPAQLKEVYGEPVDGWRNKIYWGDNLQVMSHLLKEYRGKVQLIYIDPPFDSKAEYKKQIQMKNGRISGDQSSFEEKQYSDIWTNDEYLQFMYQRLVIIKELLTTNGIIYLHIDYRKAHHIRCVMDEIFGQENLINEIIWKRRGGILAQSRRFGVSTDTILAFSKSSNYVFNQQFTKENTEDYLDRFKNEDEYGRKFRLSPIVSPSYSPTLIYEYKGYQPPANGWSLSKNTMERLETEGKLVFPKDKNQRIQRKQYLDEWEGRPVQNLWDDIAPVNPQASERLDYPTQKPEALLERIIKTSSNPGDIVFDCFMGSGTTQAVALKTGRRFIGADINLGSIQLSTKRLLNDFADLIKPHSQPELLTNTLNNVSFTNLEVYNVNYYDIFRNPVEAHDLLLEALEVQKIGAGQLFDGEKDGRLIKIMPVNRISTRADLSELITGFDYKAFDRRQAQNPGKPVEKITLVCMGHEPDLAAYLKNEVLPYNLDVEVVDILRDRQDLQFKRDSEAKITIKDTHLVIEAFYPMNLLQKLSMQKENITDWRELVESIMIDWNYDGAVLQPATLDIPEGNNLVKGKYSIPDDAGTFRVKITDLLSESLEIEVKHG